MSLFGRLEYATGHTIYNDLVPLILGNYQRTFNYIDWQREHGPTNTETDIPKSLFCRSSHRSNGKQNYTRANNAGRILNGNNSRFMKGDYLAIDYPVLRYTQIIVESFKVIFNARIYLNAQS